jgi:tetratricopeptide (TPR) repeat protein
LGASAIPIILTFALVLVAWQVVFASNRDLVMAASLPLVQGPQVWWLPYTWAIAFGVVLVVANFLSMPLDERRATRAFRTGDYAGAAALYRKLVERRPLARYWAFLGAALGAAERHEEAVDASTKAVELDPKYGLAYYNRALILQRLGRKSRATKDLKRALEADLPRRFRTATMKTLEES